MSIRKFTLIVIIFAASVSVAMDAPDSSAQSASSPQGFHVNSHGCRRRWRNLANLGGTRMAALRGWDIRMWNWRRGNR